MLPILDFLNVNHIYNFCCNKGGILPCAILYLAPPPPYRANTVSLTKYTSTISFLRTLRGSPLSRWVMIYVITFLFADFHLGRQEIAPHHFSWKPGRLEKMRGWGMARSSNKVLSTGTEERGSARPRLAECKGPKRVGFVSNARDKAGCTRGQRVRTRNARKWSETPSWRRRRRQRAVQAQKLVRRRSSPTEGAETAADCRGRGPAAGQMWAAGPRETQALPQALQTRRRVAGGEVKKRWQGARVATEHPTFAAL